jgi:hypothetical protein
MAICRLCLKDEKLIKAHIIPKGFYKYLYPKNDNSLPLKIVKNGQASSNSPIGEYDENILCAKCDGDLGIYDEYAQKIILQSNPEPFLDSGTAWKIEPFDYFLLKMFFMSLLWRASISRRDFFELVTLGPYEEKLRRMIISKNTGSADDFAVLFTQFQSKERVEITKKNITVPIRMHLENINCYIFYLPNGYKIYIKADKQSLKNTPFHKMILSDKGPIVVLNAGIFENSSEFEALLRAIKN